MKRNEFIKSIALMFLLPFKRKRGERSKYRASIPNPVVYGTDEFWGPITEEEKKEAILRSKALAQSMRQTKEMSRK